MEDRIDCHKCRYYHVTWDPSHPWGCRFYGFKGRQLPSIVVQASSGQPCGAFSPKADPGTGAGRPNR